MGPRLFSRGRQCREPSPRPARQKLQWGRGFSAAEGQAAGLGDADHLPASMGPRLFSRGRAVKTILNQRPAMVLQWGRGFSAAEGPKQVWHLLPPEQLQWGRGFSAAEGPGLVTRDRAQS